MNERTHILTKRISSREKIGIYSLRDDFEKEQRNFNKTKKIYNINPYAYVFQYRPNLYCMLTESLDGMGNPWSYLTIGPEKAMFIDTGFGLGDYKGLCDEITGGMPLIVANTHCHFDHSYGNFQFDKVHCHKNEVPLLEERMNPNIWDYLYDENGKGIWAEFDRNDMVKFKEYEIVGVPDGHIFDLGGGYEIELVFLPGHSPGHSAYLDRKNKILFGGDQTCFDGPVGLRSFNDVILMRDHMKKIVDRLDEIDAVFPGHGPIDLNTKILTDLYKACCEYSEDSEGYDIESERLMPDMTPIKLRGKFFNKSNVINYRT